MKTYSAIFDKNHSIHMKNKDIKVIKPLLFQNISHLLLLFLK